MWTPDHRRAYARVGGRYPSDMTDAEWAVLEPLIPAAKHGGRPRKTDMRAAINAILPKMGSNAPSPTLKCKSTPAVKLTVPP